MIRTAVCWKTQCCSGLKLLLTLRMQNHNHMSCSTTGSFTVTKSKQFIYVCMYTYIMYVGVSYSIKLRQVGRIVFYFFYYYYFPVQRVYGTLKQNVVKFSTTLKSLTMMLNHLDHITWLKNCANLSVLFSKRRSGNRKHTFVFSFTEMC